MKWMNHWIKMLFKTLIDKIIAVPGIEGLAFDGFGYQNSVFELNQDNIRDRVNRGIDNSKS